MSDTLGPLTAEFNGHFWDVMHDKTGKVGDTCAAGYDGVTDIPNLDNGEAYARLFAAAPDLLSALRGMMPEANMDDPGFRPSYWKCEAARAAIAKACGATVAKPNEEDDKE